LPTFANFCQRLTTPPPILCGIIEAMETRTSQNKQRQRRRSSQGGAMRRSDGGAVKLYENPAASINIP